MSANRESSKTRSASLTGRSSGDSVSQTAPISSGRSAVAPTALVGRFHSRGQSGSGTLATRNLLRSYWDLNLRQPFDKSLHPPPQTPPPSLSSQHPTPPAHRSLFCAAYSRTSWVIFIK